MITNRILFGLELLTKGKMISRHFVKNLGALYHLLEHRIEHFKLIPNGTLPTAKRHCNATYESEKSGNSF